MIYHSAHAIYYIMEIYCTVYISSGIKNGSHHDRFYSYRLSLMDQTLIEKLLWLLSCVSTLCMFESDTRLPLFATHLAVNTGQVQMPKSRYYILYIVYRVIIWKLFIFFFFCMCSISAGKRLNSAFHCESNSESFQNNNTVQ